ncbi:MAG TPA: glycosyl hydrolase family 65 protein [Adhaeribacter sp.]|nr:glycosyl hydrolase family 65 protein [Adhaeribacter sp.]
MDNWKFVYDKWVPEEQPLREALCTLGNGYFATRGAAEEMYAGGVHYPGTYLAGGYNRLISEISGREIENEDLVNWPNWLPLSFRVEGGEWFNLENMELLHYRLELDMQHGLFVRQLRFRDSEQRETSLTSRRLVSMANPHLAAMHWELIPENWSGEIEIRSAIDGNVQNKGVPRYGDLASQHLEILETGQCAPDSLFLVARTTQSKVKMAQAVRTRIFTEYQMGEPVRELEQSATHVAHLIKLNCEKQHPIQIEKVVTVYTSRDFAISEACCDARINLERAPNFLEIYDKQKRAWSHIWERCDLIATSNNRTQEILRLHIFHLLQTVSMHTTDLDVGVPARGLHGEAYRGHIFWDELFIFPYLNLRMPEVTRGLLMYRYRRLSEARWAAKEAGYRGAMYPWQSGSNGREETQVIHLNPKSGNWLPDNTHLQRHLNAAIAYNVWQYYQATEDIEFMTTYGAEMILDIALFWSSIASWNEDKKRFVICEVVGPDEYHTNYPGSDKPGLHNNAYTNVMAVWVLKCALQLLEIIDDSRLKELFELLQITEDELERWRSITKKMYIPFIENNKIIAQFEGYEKLKEFKWEKYKAQHGESMRLDRILESEGDDPNNYKASKQADVIMLFYLFPAEELEMLLGDLGYRFKAAYIPLNIDYYDNRTSHGSTLSKIVHSWVLARGDRTRSWNNFQMALLSDIEDVQGGTTPEGIHLGAMAGTVDLVQRCFAGLEIRDEVMWLDPVLPDEIFYLNLQIRYRGHWISVRINQQKLSISLDRGLSNKIQIGVKGQVYCFETGQAREFDLQMMPPPDPDLEAPVKTIPEKETATPKPVAAKTVAKKAVKPKKEIPPKKENKTKKEKPPAKKQKQ